MRRGKVEKLSISMPEFLVAHVRSKINSDELMGVSEYFQNLVRQDIKRDKRRIGTQVRMRESSELGVDDLLAGRADVLDPKSMKSAVESTIKRIMDAGIDKTNESLLE